MMNKIIKRFAIFTFLVIIVISSASCDSGKSLLDGTIWTGEISEIGYGSTRLILAFDGGNFECYADTAKATGTYSVSRNKVTLTPSDSTLASLYATFEISESEDYLIGREGKFDNEFSGVELYLASPYSAEAFESRYPIFGVSYTGYPTELTIERLLDTTSMINEQMHKASLERVFIEDDIVTLIISTYLADEESGWTGTRCIATFENDASTEACYIRSLSYAPLENPEEGIKIKHDGSVYTMGQMVGAFVEIVKTAYNS